MKPFEDEVQDRISANGSNQQFLDDTRKWIATSISARYSYNFTWLGRPVIQYPQDLVCLQEIIWSVQPDLIIETGIAHGGSLIFYASMLAQLDLCDAIEGRTALDLSASVRKVIGIDVDIRRHNRAAIEAHPLAAYIEMIEGSSVSREVSARIRQMASGRSKIMVCLDSNHTHEHVLRELELYAPLVTTGSYCMVFDTLIEDLPAGEFPDRPWGPGDNPKTAVTQFLKGHPEFAIDKAKEDKLMITAAPSGYLRRLY